MYINYKILDDIHKLLDLVLNEADLIKIGAFRKLNKLSFVSNKLL